MRRGPCSRAHLREQNGLYPSRYRNLPQEKAGITDREPAEIGRAADEPAHEFPWKAIGANKSVWTIMGATLMRARGFTEGETKLSALPWLVIWFSKLAAMTPCFCRSLECGPDRVAGIAVAREPTLAVPRLCKRVRVPYSVPILCGAPPRQSEPQLYQTDSSTIQRMARPRVHRVCWAILVAFLAGAAHAEEQPTAAMLEPVHALVTFMTRGNHTLFIPPLQLAQANFCNLGDFGGGVNPFSYACIISGLFCFEHC